MHRQVAFSLAQQMAGMIQPYCRQIDIAGSVRRGKDEVHDIELVAQPNPEVRQSDLFGGTTIHYPIQDYLRSRQKTGEWEIIKAGEKYVQLHLPYDINLDLFLVTPPAQYGLDLLIRTGPREFNVWLMTPRSSGGGKPSNAVCKDACIYINGSPVPMPTELDALNFFGLGWIRPEDRQPMWNRPFSQSLTPDLKGCHQT